MNLLDFKNDYLKLQKKHSLPSFEDMNSAFDIGKIKRDSGNFLRDIRRVMVEKVAHYIRLMEIIINPSQASPTFLLLLKEITSADKKVLDSVFSSFMEIELSSYKLDVVSNVKDETEFILKIFGVWNEKLQDLLKLLGMLERNWKQAPTLKKNTSNYFN